MQHHNIIKVEQAILGTQSYTEINQIVFLAYLKNFNVIDFYIMIVILIPQLSDKSLNFESLL